VSIYEEKKRLRKELKRKREALSKDDWRKRSDLILEQVKSCQPFNVAAVVHSFIADESRNEVNTIPLLEWTWFSQKKLLVPVVQGTELLSIEIVALENLRRNAFGILEPIEETASILENDLNIVIAPLLAVDKSGNRLGYGKGYYDRFFKRLHQGVFKLGVAFDFQVLDHIPTSENDVTLDAVATESHVLFFKGS
jgi:5-formyltetrahydrofolate cyclo-ligase